MEEKMNPEDTQNPVETPAQLAIDPPTVPTVTALGTTSVKLDWTPVTDATGYRILEGTTEAGPYTEIADTDTTSYTVTDLIPDTPYYFIIEAYDADGNVARSGYAATRTPRIEAPTGLEARPAQTEVTLNWPTIADATQYQLTRSTAANGTYTVIGTVNAPTTTYTDTGLTPATTYYYRLSAVVNGTVGDPSDPVAVTTVAAGLDAPLNVRAVAQTATSVQVDWNPVTGATGYSITRAQNVDGPYTLAGTSATTTFTDTGLTPATIYYYRVHAYNGSTTGPDSATAVVATMADTIEPPTNLTAIGNSPSSIRLNWTPPASVVDGYRIYRSPTIDGTYTQVGTTNGTEYIDTNLTAGTTYYYKVEGYRGTQTGRLTQPVAGTTPTAPTPQLTATPLGTRCVHLTWTAAGNSELHRIMRSSSPNGPFQLVDTVPGTANSFDDCGLRSGHTYYYRLESVEGGTVTTLGPASVTTLRGQIRSEPCPVMQTNTQQVTCCCVRICRPCFCCCPRPCCPRPRCGCGNWW